MPRERHGDDRLVLTVAARGRRAGSGRPGAHPRGDAETVASHTRHHRELNAAHRAHQPPVSPRSCCLRRRDRLPRSVHRRRLSRDAGPRPIDRSCADSTQPAQFPGRQARRCGRLACGVGLAPNATGSQRVEPVLPQARPCRSGRPRSPVRPLFGAVVRECGSGGRCSRTGSFVAGSDRGGASDRLRRNDESGRDQPEVGQAAREPRAADLYGWSDARSPQWQPAAPISRRTRTV